MTRRIKDSGSQDTQTDLDSVQNGTGRKFKLKKKKDGKFLISSVFAKVRAFLTGSINTLNCISYT